MVNEISILDKTFVKYISRSEIELIVKKVAKQIDQAYAGKEITFLCVLNGSFMYAADLCREVSIESEIHFVKLASYNGLESSGVVNELIGLNTSLNGKHIIVIEDIVDTGNTLEKIIEIIGREDVLSVAATTFLFKPECYNGSHPVEFWGREIEDKFVVGYGLDYDNKGRNLKDIYQLKV